MAEMQKTLITKEGLEKMQKELEDLRTTKRAEVAQRLKEAIAMGDLSENSEYDEAKNAQAFLEGRIVQLEQQIRTAQIIVKGKKNRIDVGSTVTIEDMEEYVKETVT
ncbi:GreA/GreB family elongation factor, partial [Dialister hominis]